MPVCDLCNGPAIGKAKQVSASQFRTAVMTGLRPSPSTLSALGNQFGMSNDEAYAIWFQQALKSDTDWLLCETCATKIK